MKLTLGARVANCSWKLTVFGAFRLEKPDGTEAKVNQRKVEGLLTLLALNKESGLDRDEVGAILWPQKDRITRRDNLKQTLAELRKIIGYEAVDANRARLNLSEDISISADMDDGARKGKIFCPRQEGSWFHQMRCEIESRERNSVESAVSALGRTLLWLRDRDPRAMYGVMSQTVGLASGLTASQLFSLASGTGPVEGWNDWRQFWIANSLHLRDDSRSFAAEKEALRLSLASGNEAVSSRILNTAVGNLLVKGKLSQADAIVQRVSNLGLSKHPMTIRARGLVDLHTGHFDKAFERLRYANGFLTDKDELCVMRSILGYLYASVGEMEKATQEVTAIRPWAVKSGHATANSLISITDGLLDISDGKTEKGLNMLSHSLIGVDEPALAIYAQESIAVTLKRVGETGPARTKWRVAQNLRNGLGMKYTPWDRARITCGAS